MRIVKAHIDGFGAFRDADFEFAPGLSVIFGPNEAGKSTLHEFLIGMLYGLKKPDQPRRRAFEEAFERYRPWKGRAYGGRLQYELAGGECFEVYRRFGRRSEQLRIHALPGGADRTGEFARLRNGEVLFAREHLGLGKRLFTSAACISHASVSRLAPEDALTQVRDRIAALLETGREDASGKRAVEALTQAIRAVGSDRARTRPVARLRRRLETLQAERETVLAARRELSALVKRRRELENLTADLADRVAETRRRLDAVRRAELRRILREARKAQADLEKLGPEIETLAAYERFPAGEAERLVELKREFDLHREDLARTEKDLEKVTGRLERLQADLEPLRPAAEMPQNALEVISGEAAHLADAEHRVALLTEQDRRLAADEEAARRRLAPLENRRRQVQPILEAGEDALAELSRLEEAVETARRRFHEAQVTGENLHVHTLQCREQLERLEPIFEGVTADIEDLRTRYEAGQRTFETIRQEIAPELNRRRARRFELGATIQQHVALGWITLFIGLGVGAVPLVLRAANSALYFLGGAGLVAAAAFFFIRQWAMTRTLRRLDEEVAAFEERLAREKGRLDRHSAAVEGLLEGSPYRSLAEYIRAYGTYLRLRGAYEEAQAEERQAAVRAQEVHDRLQEAHARAREILGSAGIELDALDDLPRAVARFRDAYRRARQVLEDVRDVERDLEFVRERRRAVAAQLDAARGESAGAAARIKQLCREAGLDPDAADDPGAAVEAFKDRFRRARVVLGQMEECAGRQADLKARRAQAARAAEQARRKISAILQRAGVENVEEFRVGLERHRRLARLKAERERVAERHQRLLAGRSMEEIERQLEALGPDPEEAGEAAPVVMSAERADRLGQTLAEDTARLASWREELAEISARVKSHLAPYRDLAAIDEDIAETGARLERLVNLREALEIARRTVEEVGRHVYASVAPRLNEVIGRTIAEITDGRYREVTVDEDLQVWVRVPETGRRLPPDAFSRGAIDQFYLTLRLSVVDLITDRGEPVPLILDDPFTNYDDQRLTRAMKVLARRAETHQVLLFTCQRRVRDRARGVGGRVVTLKA